MDGMSSTVSSAESSGELSALSTPDLAARITELAADMNAANHRLLALIAEFDRRGGWAGEGMQSCAHWLHWQCGIDLGAAREKVRVAHAVAKLPAIGAAMERGELSYAKVRAVTRVADAGNEGVFLRLALERTAHEVERIAAQWREGSEDTELSREAQQQQRRKLYYHWEPDGSLALHARLPAETGMLVIKALERALDDLWESDAEPCASWSMRQADALVLVSESFLAHGAEAMTGGDRHQVVVHVDAATFAAGQAGRCELEEGPAIAAETARRLACDSSVVTIANDDRGEPLDVGRKTRAIPPAMRRALAARDKGCRFPGCTHTRFVDGHHVKHWARGGDTKLANLVTLCRFHHRAVHEGRLAVERLDDGAWRFTKPDGSPVEPLRPRAAPMPVDKISAETLVDKSEVCG